MTPENKQEQLRRSATDLSVILGCSHEHATQMIKDVIDQEDYKDHILVSEALNNIAVLQSHAGRINFINGIINQNRTTNKYSPCPCGSGEKYKFCCGKKKLEAKRNYQKELSKIKTSSLSIPGP